MEETTDCRKYPDESANTNRKQESMALGVKKEDYKKGEKKSHKYTNSERQSRRRGGAEQKGKYNRADERKIGEKR